ncbi:PorT family protein [Dysgonomonas sp. Marseille-P4677]|uniref:outer membrane beta-barrel protein n=1 Tax=Dysgonomonas sp. Marseille-P4677 TaxID=2364790 RepID=UPI0019145504|nr:outer membrane beta-barrel protein [Dysgonomonas sp. Marseille-P4677]MBK5719725.1 PorT family protein [Dysgonomonas sp. Marseille-P4677]
MIFSSLYDYIVQFRIVAVKILFIGVFLIAGICASYSQKFGVQVGARINTSGIEYSGVNISRKAGFEGGITYLHSVDALPLSFRAAILYFNDGFSLKNDMGNNTGITYHFEEDHLKLPLTIEWSPFTGAINPFLQAGLYTSYSLSGKIKESDSSSSLKYKKSSDRLDYGAIVGIGVYLTPHLALNARYEHGFMSRDLVLGDQFVSVKGRGYSIGLNYLF